MGRRGYYINIHLFSSLNMFLRSGFSGEHQGDKIHACLSHHQESE